MGGGYWYLSMMLTGGRGLQFFRCCYSSVCRVPVFVDVNVQVCEELVLVCVSIPVCVCVEYWYLWVFTFQYILVMVFVGINISVHMGVGGLLVFVMLKFHCVGTCVGVLCYYCTSVLYTCVY